MPDSSSSILLTVELDPRINFAMQQNDVPVVKSLQITNPEDVPLHDLTVNITGDPEFIAPWTSGIAAISGNSAYRLPSVDLALSLELLSNLTERIRGQLRIEVLQGEHPLIRKVMEVDLLARDEWGGISSLPEILSAFVLPNHPAVAMVLKEAATILEKWTGDPSLAGYQHRDPRRVYTMTAAVYAALVGLRLIYINPPASFESQGQRVRLPEHVLATQMGTCLDLALLAASCLETIGLNAVLVLTTGHAMPGVWLSEKCFAEASSDDGLNLRKRIDLSELAVFEATAATSRPALDFDRAANLAKSRIGDGQSVQCVIDVARARKGRIRPLPERAPHQPTAGGLAELRGDKSSVSPPDLSNISSTDSSEEIHSNRPPATPAGRVEQWCNKLLDLTLRNRLLNFRETKKTVTLLCPNLGALEDLLAGRTSLHIFPKSREFADTDPRDPITYQRTQGHEAIADILADELKAKRIYADANSQELDRRLVEIFRHARTEMEEGGASALYLALGFLSWYETEKSEQPRLAPILLLPLELQRKSIHEGFTLHLTDDDPRINVTLLELLKRDFGITIGGLDPLPEDDSGLDVPLILRKFREAVRDIRRWTVVDNARFGFFSFTKFLMWRDLKERSEDLTRNPVVDHLVNHPDEEFDSGGAFPEIERLDDEHSPAQTLCPLPADSSQLRAVFAAADGRSFVLEGPPGTGKSQTITNLIAHCLAEGKTVLFVSEKMAALNVVHSRLMRLGLGRFCLELHSNKVQKQRIVEQLGTALDDIELAAGEDQWQRDAAELEALRGDLNAYVRASHAKRPSGESVFQVTSRLIGLRQIPEVSLQWQSPDQVSPEWLAELRDLVARLATAGRNLGELSRHPWKAAGASDWGPIWERDVRTAVGILNEAVEPLAEAALAVGSKLGLSPEYASLEELETMESVTRLLLDSPAPPSSLVTRPDWNELEACIESWVEHGRMRDEKREAMRRRFEDQIIHLDLDILRSELQIAKNSWWPASWWRCRRIRKVLGTVSVDRTVPDRGELQSIIDDAIVLRSEQRKLEEGSDEAREILGRYWNHTEADWEAVAQVRDWARDLRGLAGRASAGDFERSTRLRTQWAALATDGLDLLRGDGPIKRLFGEFGSAIEAFRGARHRLAELLDLETNTCWGSDSAADAAGRTRSEVQQWTSGFAQLRDWCAWRRVRGEAVQIGLANLVNAYEEGRLSNAELAPAFEKGYSTWWLAVVIERDEVLRRFLSAEHERKILKFREVDDRFMALTSQVVRGRMALRIPRVSMTDLPNSELGILSREVKKKRRHLSVRQLLQRIPNLLPRLKPCLLMSPMSVAQYLDASHPPFDLVVFDEASQIPVWDAIGALGRGRQSIVVGDPKQLPPTNFFQRSDEDDELPDESGIEDLESILDDCLGARIPWLHLDWHYRSRDETLIAFSNHQYYGNRLLTFPSAATDGLGVRWQHVAEGVYDKGKSRTNRAEAQAVVQEVIRRLTDPETRGYSIGVVTFSQPQQTLIEDLLDSARRADPELERFFGDDADEPLFIKNLENVQGDERDVILFSICYGPDTAGRVSMNFGPMNRGGGERRLNVAITRARREVKVFSTLRPEQIDLSRTRARGVADLKLFLEYAQRGPSAIAAGIDVNPEADFDSPFEEAVCNELTNRGWVVHKQVGCARYRIDLAVVDPEASGRYLMGIECDGATYHRAKTARDRDKLREGILTDLGWKLHRVWSTDWWTNPAKELGKIVTALAAATSDVKQGSSERHAPKVVRERPREFDASSVVPQTDVLPIQRKAPRHEVYRPVAPPKHAMPQESFYLPENDSLIQSQLRTVIAQEGPTSVGLAAKRVAAMWSFERVRSRVFQRLQALMESSDFRIQHTSAGEFLWPSNMDPNTYRGFRVPDEDGTGARHAEELPLEEVGNAALHILRDHMSAPITELIRETGRIFGFQRTGTLVDERIRLGIDALVRRGAVRIDRDTVILQDKHSA
ncbi:MAG: DUF3320 domain-containing protein [Acidobacteriota bacterium]